MQHDIAQDCSKPSVRHARGARTRATALHPAAAEVRQPRPGLPRARPPRRVAASGEDVEAWVTMDDRRGGTSSTAGAENVSGPGYPAPSAGQAAPGPGYPAAGAGQTAPGTGQAAGYPGGAPGPGGIAQASSGHAGGGRIGTAAPQYAGPHAWQSEPDWQRDPGPAGAPAPAAPGSGWVAASKPGLIPLRPLILGDILGATFRLLRTSPKTSIGSSVLILSVINVVSYVAIISVLAPLIARADSASAEDRETMIVTAYTLTGLVTLVPLALSMAGTSLLQGILVHVTARGALGERVTFRASWRVAMRRFWPLIAYTLLLSAVSLVLMIIIGGAIFASILLMQNSGIAGGILMAVTIVLLTPAGALAYLSFQTKALFVPSAILLEQKGIAGGVRRSWQLTRGAFWRTLGITLLVWLIINSITSLALFAPQLFFGIFSGVIAPFGVGGSDLDAFSITFYTFALLITSLLNVTVTAFTMVLSSGNAAILYLDRRMRTEGLNLRMQQYRDELAAGREPQDPFMPSESTPGQAPVPQGSPAQGAAPGNTTQGSPAQGIPPQGASASGIAPQGGPAQGVPAQSDPSWGIPAPGIPPQGAPAQGTQPREGQQ